MRANCDSVNHKKGLFSDRRFENGGYYRTTNAKKHFRNSTSLSQTFMHNENLNQNRQSANFNDVMTL